MDTNLFTIAPVIIDTNDQSRLDVSLNKIRILKMKYFHRFTIFIIIMLFSVSPSFSQDWRKLTTQEFKNWQSLIRNEPIVYLETSLVEV